MDPDPTTTNTTAAASARALMERCDTLGAISEEPDRRTRRYATPAMREVNALVADWMRGAGMSVWQDAIGNLIGRYEAASDTAEQGAGPKTLLLGSHLDTVRDAGRYDGPLGVLVGLAAVEELRAQRIKFPFHVEIAGFSDE